MRPNGAVSARCLEGINQVGQKGSTIPACAAVTVFFPWALPSGTIRAANQEGARMDAITTMSPQFLRRADVLQMTRISAATLRRLIRKGDFPEPVKLSVGIWAWPTEAVTRWQETRPRAGS